MIEPIVSVIMPTYNNAQYIEKAIESVLIQNVQLELIIINDCSTDSTENIIQKYLKLPNIKYIRNSINLGVAKSRNIGVSIAKGRYIAYLDSDDFWLPTKLEKQIKIMELDKYPICFTGRELVNSNGTSTGVVFQIQNLVDYNMLLRHNCISCSSVMLPINIARSEPMCHDELHEDFINWLTILKNYGIAYGINEPLLKYRLSENGKSRNRLKSARMTYGVYQYMGIGKTYSTMLMFSHLFHGIIKYTKKYR